MTDGDDERPLSHLAGPISWVQELVPILQLFMGEGGEGPTSIVGRNAEIRWRRVMLFLRYRRHKADSACVQLRVAEMPSKSVASR
jgi:hypothetical protein